MKKKEIEAHLRIVEQEIQKLQKKLERYPEGKISCLKNGKYIQAKLEDAIMEQKALSKYMKTVNGYEPKEELFFQNLFYGEIVSEKMHKTDMSAN